MTEVIESLREQDTYDLGKNTSGAEGQGKV